jgi:hypothetical protein
MVTVDAIERTVHETDDWVGGRLTVDEAARRAQLDDPGEAAIEDAFAPMPREVGEVLETGRAS